MYFDIRQNNFIRIIIVIFNMSNKWASQQQKKETQSFNCTCNGVFISFLSNTNRLVFNAIGLRDLHKNILIIYSVLMMLRQQI